MSSNLQINNETEEWLKENSVDYDIRFDGYFDFIKFSNLNGSYYKWELTLKHGAVKHNSTTLPMHLVLVNMVK